MRVDENVRVDERPFAHLGALVIELVAAESPAAGVPWRPTPKSVEARSEVCSAAMSSDTFEVPANERIEV